MVDRSEVLALKLSVGEKNLIAENASEYGMTMSAYVRMKLFGIRKEVKKHCSLTDSSPE